MSKPVRGDAERNRGLVLAAAERLFGERGDEVHMSQVAAEAGVGVGTVYRHFPTRQALIAAVAERRFAGILEFARQQCLPEPDPMRALTRFLDHVAEVHEQGRGLSGVIEATFGSTEPRGATSADLLEVGTELLRRGIDQGVVAPGLTVEDLYMVVGAVAFISRNGIGDRHRFVALTVEGLRSRPARR